MKSQNNNQQSEYSAGIIIYRLSLTQNSEIEYLLLHKSREQYWNFAKGRRESGEDLLTTALREVHEETGIESRYLAVQPDFLEQYTYSFVAQYGERKDQTIAKEDFFYLAQLEGNVDIRLSDEHDAYEWCTYERALELFEYPTLTALLKKAHRVILENISDMVY